MATQEEVTAAAHVHRGAKKFLLSRLAETASKKLHYLIERPNIHALIWQVSNSRINLLVYRSVDRFTPGTEVSVRGWSFEMQNGNNPASSTVTVTWAQTKRGTEERGGGATWPDSGNNPTELLGPSNPVTTHDGAPPIGRGPNPPQRFSWLGPTPQHWPRLRLSHNSLITRFC